MAGDEDDIESFDDDEPMLDDHEPGSGKRIKKSAAGMRVLFAELRARSEGLTGAEFERELDRFIDRIVERNVGVAPVELRDELRDTMRSYLENDPTLSAMVAELRAAARR